MKTAISLLVCALMVHAPVTASAQSYWGISGGVVPSWTMPASIGELIDLGVDQLGGRDFQIGVARGRDQGGNWDVVFTQVAARRGSRVDGYFYKPLCLLDKCATDGEYFITDSAKLRGVEIRRFFVFGAIKRVQLGMVAGGGVGRIGGRVDRHTQSAEIDADPATGFVRGYKQTERTVPLDTKSLFERETWPMVRLEAAASVLISKGVKVRLSGGLGTLRTYRSAVSFIFLPGAR